MNELSTLPLSVSQHLERSAGTQEVTPAMVQQARYELLRTIALQRPDFAALLVAADMGYRNGIGVTMSERESVTIHHEKRALGIRYSESFSERVWERESSKRFGF